MTTIAYKDGIIAADSQVTMEDIVANYEFIKIQVIPKIINEKTVEIPIAMAGKCTDFIKYINYFKQKEDIFGVPDEEIMPELEEFSGVFYYDGNFYEVDDDLIPLQVGSWGSIGSGCLFAMGALQFGASAIEAVAVSKELDVRTGKSIHYVDVKEMIVRRA